MHPNVSIRLTERTRSHPSEHSYDTVDMPSMRTRHRDDLRLVRRMLEGDETAFEEFSNSYIPVLYRFAQRRLYRDQDLVADLVQTTLCKVIPKMGSPGRSR